MTQKVFQLEDGRIELERRRVLLDTKIDDLLATIGDSGATGDCNRARMALEGVMLLGEVKTIVSGIVDALGASEKPLRRPVYTVSSWFLEDCRRYLVQRDVEALHYVTGVRFGSVITLDRMVSFEMSRQTPGFASGDIKSTHRAHLEMETRGHKLHAVFHSHPGQGAGSTFPSGIDLNYQSRLERGGYAAIGGIFSRDGYFRAFSVDMPFQLILYGKGAERIDENLYHLSEVN